MSLYYISNGRSSFLKRRGKFFLKNGTPSVGGFIGHAYGVRVLRIDRPDGRRVLKFDGSSGRGLWYRPWTHLRCEGSQD